jgi:hypothetical protein
MHGGGHFEWKQNIDAARWEAALSKVVSALRQQGWEPCFLAHNEAEFRLAAGLWPDCPRVQPTGLPQYFETIRDAAFGVFNRLHAGVAAAGLGIPSVTIGTDTRNLMIERLGLRVFYVKSATADDILGAIERTVDDREAEASRLLALREATLAAYEARLRPFLPMRAAAT